MKPLRPDFSAVLLVLSESTVGVSSPLVAFFGDVPTSLMFRPLTASVMSLVLDFMAMPSSVYSASVGGSMTV
ncbi:hypothetical protein D3C81_2199710 [compost metagenome]